ncbi:MAG: hypothetical protein WCC90_23985, partial [Methylocella sp.]
NQPYAWLKYFLAPMQDGKFKGADTEEIYTAGRAIFVFAGGTADNFENFKEKVSPDKSVKGLDFISRLKAHLDIQSINGEPSSPDEQAANNRPQEKICILLRRAINLRSILEREASEILDGKKNARIDDKVAEAFLWIDKYEHGIRSMEAIVKMAQPDNGWLRVASLPSDKQLSMHVNERQFLGLARYGVQPDNYDFGDAAP